MTLDDELAAAMQQLGPQAFWRPLNMVQDLLRSKEPQEVVEPLARCLLDVDFQGKSVVELGSNIGFYSFLAAQLGAREVHALDFGPAIVRIGGLLAEAYNMPQVHFEQVDFCRQEPGRKWDLVLVLDIIGNNKVRKGRVAALLDVVLRYVDKELVLNARPVYDLASELGVTEREMLEFYPAKHLREGRLHLLEYLTSWFGNSWEVTPLACDAQGAALDKPPFLFRRRQAP